MRNDSFPIYLFSALSLLLFAAGCTQLERVGCTSDDDCLNSRICHLGQCRPPDTAALEDGASTDTSPGPDGDSDSGFTPPNNSANTGNSETGNPNTNGDPGEMRGQLLSTGRLYTCQVRSPSEETVRCWKGVDTETTLTPELEASVDLDIGDRYGCGINADNELNCWGPDSDGLSEVPDGSFKQVSVGPVIACAVTLDNEVKCWGDEDLASRVPESEQEVDFVSVGTDHICVRNVESGHSCWAKSSRPFEVMDYKQRNVELAGHYYTCSISGSGSVYCTGEFTAPEPDGTFETVALGLENVCGLRSNGDIDCWGANGDALSRAGNFTNLDVGDGFVCAVDATGEPTCWEA